MSVLNRKLLEKTLTNEELSDYDEISVGVIVSLEEIIDRDLEELNDLVEERILAIDSNYILSDIGYEVVGVKAGAIILKVGAALESIG